MDAACLHLQAFYDQGYTPVGSAMNNNIATIY